MDGGLVFGVPGSGLRQELHALDGADEGPAVDDAGAAAVVDAGDGLGVVQVGVHAGLGIDEPGMDDARGALGVARVVQEKGRGAEREHGVAHGIERVLVGHEAAGVDLAVAAHIRAVGILGIGPPVGRLAVVVVGVQVDAFGPVGSDGPGPSLHALVGLGAQAADGVQRPGLLADDGAVDRLGFVLRDQRHREVRGPGTRHGQDQDDAVFTICDCSGCARADRDAALVFGVELAANQGDDGHQVHPDQQGDTGAHRAVHHVVVADVADVPGEPGGGQQPQDRGQDGAGPHVAPALPAVGAEIVQAGGDDYGGGEGQGVARQPAEPLPDPGDAAQEGSTFIQSSDRALHLAAEDAPAAEAQSNGHGGDQHQRHGDGALVEEIAVARNAIGRLEALDQALDDAGCGPKGDQARRRSAASGPRAGDAELLHDQVFGAGRNDLREPFSSVRRRTRRAFAPGWWRRR